MSLALKSFSDAFKFVIKYPNSLLFTLVLNLIVFLPAYFLLYLLKPIIYLTSIYSFVGMAIVLVILVILAILINLILLGSFPLIVFNSLKKGNFSFIDVIKKSFGRILDIFFALLIISIIVLLPVIISILPISFTFVFVYNKHIPALYNGPTSLLTNLLISTSTSILLLFFVGLGIIVGAYLYSRLWLTYPILMIEKKNSIESIKTSWKISKGRVLSIVLTLILLAIVLGILSAFEFVIPEDNIIANFIWRAVYGTYSLTLGGVLDTIYYLNLTRRIKKIL
jgi:hypothetical protein